MPVLNGLDATKQIRAEHLTEAKIIALTANAMARDKEMYLSNGFDDYIQKPLQLKVLKETLIRNI